MLLGLPDHSYAHGFDAADTQGAGDQDGGWMISFVDILMLLLTLFVLLLAYHAAQQPATETESAGDATAKHAADIPPAMQSEPVMPVEWASVATVALEPLTATAPVVDDAKPNLVSDSLFALEQPLAAEALLMALRATEQPAPLPAPDAASAAPALEIPAEIRDRVEVATTADAVNLIIKDEVLFDRASADLKLDAHSILDDIVALLRRNQFAVSVEGHTDDTPIQTARYPSNWDLSVARATHVTRYLIEHGVDRQRLRAVGYADTRPLEAAATAQARARNRRVSLVVHLRQPQADTVVRQVLKTSSPPATPKDS